MIGAIIQVRINSKRLHAKALKTLGSKTLLENILLRLKKATLIDNIIIATTILESDNVIEKFSKEYNIPCFRGSENNVLKRFYECAEYFKLNHIIRITGDNPLIDEVELDNLIKLHLDTSSDYSTSINNLPKGMGSEIFTFETLKKSFYNASSNYEKEHLNAYVLNNMHNFKISKLIVAENKNKPHLNFSIDTPKDYELMYNLFKKINSESSIEYAIKFLEEQK